MSLPDSAADDVHVRPIVWLHAQVFPSMEGIKVNGTKSLIGHCLGAAGGLEAVATIQAIRTGWLHPTLNQVRAADPVKPPKNPAPWPPFRPCTPAG